MFQVHHKMQGLLSQERNIFVTGTAINCASISAETIQAGCGIWEGVQQCMARVTVLIYVNI
jgi:hypothetical protein